MNDRIQITNMQTQNSPHIYTFWRASYTFACVLYDILLLTLGRSDVSGSQLRPSTLISSGDSRYNHFIIGCACVHVHACAVTCTPFIAGIRTCRRIVAHMERTPTYLCLQNNVRRRMHMPAGTRWPANTHAGVSSPTWSVHRRTSSCTCSMHPVP